MYLPNWLYITRSNNFDNKGKTLTGRKFVLSVGSSFLCSGVIFAFFEVIGNFPLIKAQFTQIVSSLKEKYHPVLRRPFHQEIHVNQGNQ